MDVSRQWIGRLVRVLLLFRALLLLGALISLPAAQRTPAVAVPVLAAVCATYLPLRRWDRVAGSLQRHPAYILVELSISSALLATAGARGPFFYFTLGTAALAGVVYGRRGAVVVMALFALAYELIARSGLGGGPPLSGLQSLLLAALLYPAAVVAGVAARELIERGVATEELLRERTEALAAEQTRTLVARELHDSLAKTVEGLAMTASVLPAHCERDPSAAAALAGQLVRDARQAALEARALMSGLRSAEPSELSLSDALRAQATALSDRFGVTVAIDGDTGIELPADSRHELLRIVSEAMLNAVSHGQARTVAVALSHDHHELRVTVSDDGSGIGGPVDFERLKLQGHYGLAGMRERAQRLGGTLALADGGDGGAVVELALPVPAGSSQAEPAALKASGPADWAQRIWRPAVVEIGREAS